MLYLTHILHMLVMWSDNEVHLWSKYYTGLGEISCLGVYFEPYESQLSLSSRLTFWILEARKHW